MFLGSGLYCKFHKINTRIINECSGTPVVFKFIYKKDFWLFIIKTENSERFNREIQP